MLHRGSAIGRVPALCVVLTLLTCALGILGEEGLPLHGGGFGYRMAPLESLGGLLLAFLLLAAACGVRRRRIAGWLIASHFIQSMLLTQTVADAWTGDGPDVGDPGGVSGPVAMILLGHAIRLALRGKRLCQRAILIGSFTLAASAVSAGLLTSHRAGFMAPGPDILMSMPVAVLVAMLSLALMHWQYRAGRQDLPWRWQVEGWLLRSVFALCVLVPVISSLLLLWTLHTSAPSAQFVETVRLGVQIMVCAVILCWSWARIRAEMSAHAALMGALDGMPIALVSLRGDILHWSRGCERLYQWTAEEAQGRIKHQLLGIDVPGRWEGMMGRLYAGLPCEEEIFEQRRDGTPLVVLEQARIVRRITDREPVVVLSMTDITARVRAEEALRASDARLALAVEAHGIGIFEWDARAGAFNLSPVAEMLSELAPGSFRGGFGQWRRHLQSVFDIEWAPSGDTAAGSHPSGFGFHLRRHRADGRLNVIEGAARCIYGRDGRLARMIGVMFDKSEGEERAAALRERESIFRSIVKTVPDAMISTDESGIVRAFSATAERLLGYGDAEVIGRSINMLLPDRHRCNSHTILRDYADPEAGARSGAARPFAILHSNGIEIPVEISVGEAWIGEERIYIGFFRDMTERLSAQSRLAELREELIHVSRLHAMGEVAAGLAHELNQPLAAISNFLGAADVLLDFTPGEHQQVRQYVTLAGKQSLRAGEIIRRMRDFSSRGPGGLGPERLSEVVTDAVDLVFAGRASGQSMVRIDIDPEQPLVHVDRVQIQQVIVNLLRNAIEALADGASVSPEIRIQSRAAGQGMVEIEVRDNGPGFPAEVLSRRYQPFFSTKRDGMGIGLSICRRIIEAHGGTLSIESRPGAGAAMRFTVPRAGASERMAA